MVPKSEYEWTAWLRGKDEVLEDLSKISTHYHEIQQEEEKYALHSSLLESLETKKEVKSRAEWILDIIYGIAKAEMSLGDAPKVHQVTHISDPPTAKVVLQLHPKNDDADIELLGKYTELALEDEIIAELGRYLARGDDWGTLSKILEYIQDNIRDDENIVDKGWISENKKSQFTANANNKELTGLEARHATESGGDLPEPMPHSEARGLVYDLVKEWLEHRKK